MSEQKTSYGTGPRPEDDTPSDSMLQLVKSGGHVTPREAAVPHPDHVDSVKLAIVDGDDPTVASYVFELNGANDPIMTAVARRYAESRDNAPRTTQDRIAQAASIYMEVCAAKRADGQDPLLPPPPFGATQPAQSVTSQRLPAQSPTPKPTVQLTFDLGPAGKMIGRYRRASIQGTLLVLVADEDMSESGLYLPPNTGANPDGSILVSVPGIPKPVRVFSMDMVFKDAGNVFCILLIDRTDE